MAECQDFSLQGSTGSQGASERGNQEAENHQHGNATGYKPAAVRSTLSIRTESSLGTAAHEERKRRGRVIGIASTVEGAMIFAAIADLVKLGRRDLIAPAVAVIVGLHFLPIARWLPAPIYYLTAALLVAVGMAGAIVQDLPARILTVCIGAAAALWLSCGMVLLRADRQRNQSVGEKV